MQEKLHVVIVLFNDSAFTAVKRVQQREYGGRYVAIDLVSPDYVALAHAFGAKGVRVHNPEELRNAVEAAIGEDATTLIEAPLPSWRWSSKS